jgi:hypothetical protein
MELVFNFTDFLLKHMYCKSEQYNFPLKFLSLHTCVEGINVTQLRTKLGCLLHNVEDFLLSSSFVYLFFM